MVSLSSIRVKTACCCLSLRTGNLIVGWLGTIGWSVLMVACIAVLAAGDEDFIIRDKTELEVLSTVISPKEEQKKPSMTAILVLIMLLCLANALISMAHLYGTYKYLKSYLKPHLILGAIQLGATAFSVVFGLITADVDRFCSSLLTLAIGIYFYLIPWSFYKEIDEGHAPVEHCQGSMQLE